MGTILIADDNGKIIEVLKQYAIKENYSVYTSYDGEETLEEFCKRKFETNK